MQPTPIRPLWEVLEHPLSVEDQSKESREFQSFLKDKYKVHPPDISFQQLLLNLNLVYLQRSLLCLLECEGSRLMAYGILPSLALVAVLSLSSKTRIKLTARDIVVLGSLVLGLVPFINFHSFWFRKTTTNTILVCLGFVCTVVKDPRKTHLVTHSETISIASLVLQLSISDMTYLGTCVITLITLWMSVCCTYEPTQFSWVLTVINTLLGYNYSYAPEYWILIVTLFVSVQFLRYFSRFFIYHVPHWDLAKIQVYA